jgi:hypothetical protein
MSEILIDCACENYKGPNEQCLDFKFSLSFNTVPAPETETGAEDLLKIQFSHSKPVPEEVRDYISSNLGVFDLTEAGHEKTLVFELKINDINIELIRKVFEKYFAPEASKAFLSLAYSRTQKPEDWYAEFKSRSEVPLLLHLLEHSKVKLEGQDVINILKGLFSYVKSENPMLLQPWMNLLLTLASLKTKGVVNSYNKLPENIFKEMEFEQRDNIKDFFFLMDNPINNYVFEAGEPGRLKISGRILNILNYEFEGSFPNLQGFLGEVLLL